MENIFHNDIFFSSGDELLEWIEDNEECTIEELPEDYIIEINNSDYEPVFKIDIDWIIDRIPEERYSEDGVEREIDKISKALSECIDFDKLNSMIPRLHYSQYKAVKLTKADLLKYV